MRITVVIIAFILGILSSQIYDQVVTHGVFYCYLDALDVRNDPDHGLVWTGQCDNGQQVEIAEHD